jgi:hypothetical protein
MTLKHKDGVDQPTAAWVTEAVRLWLEPLLAGGLSAARSSPIGVTAERLAETILIGLENTLLGESRRFSVPEDEPVDQRRGSEKI